MKGRVVQQEKRKCPHCSSTELEYREEGLVCLNCGGILEEGNVVPQEGRRYFSSKEKVRKSRVSSFSTVSYESLSSTEKYQWGKIQEIADIVGSIARKFNYGRVKARKVREEVKSRFGEYLRSKKIRGKDIYAGALFRILTGEPLAEVASKIEVEESDIWDKEVGIREALKIDQRTKKRKEKMRRYLKRKLEKIGVSEVFPEAYEIYKEVSGKPAFIGSNPRILSLASAYIVCESSGRNLSYRSFTGEFGITQSSLKDKVREIERYIKKEGGKSAIEEIKEKRREREKETSEKLQKNKEETFSPSSGVNHKESSVPPERAYQRIKKRIENNQLPVFFSTRTLGEIVRKEGASFKGWSPYLRKKLEQDGYKVREEGSDWIISEKEDLKRSEVEEIRLKLQKPKEKLEEIIRENSPWLDRKSVETHARNAKSAEKYLKTLLSSRSVEEKSDRTGLTEKTVEIYITALRAVEGTYKTHSQNPYTQTLRKMLKGNPQPLTEIRERWPREDRPKDFSNTLYSAKGIFSIRSDGYRIFYLKGEEDLAQARLRSIKEKAEKRPVKIQKKKGRKEYRDKEFMKALSEPRTISSVVNVVGCSYSTARKRLEKLHDSGRINRKRRGKSFIYFKKEEVLSDIIKVDRSIVEKVLRGKIKENNSRLEEEETRKYARLATNVLKSENREDYLNLVSNISALQEKTGEPYERIRKKLTALKAAGLEGLLKGEYE